MEPAWPHGRPTDVRLRQFGAWIPAARPGGLARRVGRLGLARRVGRLGLARRVGRLGLARRVGRLGQASRAGWLVGVCPAIIAMVGIVLVTGCGQVPAAGPAGGSGQPPASAGPARFALCADPAGVSRVRIVRIPSLGQLPVPAGGPRRVIKLTIADPVKARMLARAVCALPRIPNGVFHCPPETGGGYQLDFTAQGRGLPPVNVQARGCKRVTGAGVIRWVARTPSFWAVLARVTGIPAIAHRP